MKYKKWLIGWCGLVIIMLTSIGVLVYNVDPFFHYHAPYTEKYYYSLYNERSQNNGIIKHFEYNALITGTSMTENFKTSELDELFSVNSIKIPYSGATYKEINDSLAVALESNPDIQVVVRSLDYSCLFKDKNSMRTDLGEYPAYLYDSNPFNDVFYLFNKEVIFSRSYDMVEAVKLGRLEPGIAPFDSYARWQDGHDFTFGKNTVIPAGISVTPGEAVHLTEEEKSRIYGNIMQNVTSLADSYPNVYFYYFFPPYCAAWWAEHVNDGTIYKWLEADEYTIELILDHPNIKLYSFNNCTDITTNLNFYKDTIHYGEWINSYMLRAMRNGDCLLTKENYRSYLQEERNFYTTFDYDSLNEQIDYVDDSYAGELIGENSVRE